MLDAMGQLERRTDEESRRLRTLEENVLDIEGDVEVNLNTTAYLENKMLVMERDGEKDQFERQVRFPPHFYEGLSSHTCIPIVSKESYLISESRNINSNQYICRS